MKKLNELPQMVDEALGGLVADEHMKLQIMKAAAAPENKEKHPKRRAWLVPSVCAAALVVAVAVVLPKGVRQISGEKVLGVSSAGTNNAAEQNETDYFDGYGDEYSVFSDKSRMTAANHFAINSTGATPSYHSIWSENVGSSAPLVRVNGRFYRMMKKPSSLPSGTKGDSLGTVGEFTDEPALSSTKCIMSNVAAEGTEVFAVDGMGKTLVCADVDGVTRVFQRTSFSGNALLGSEGIADVLQISGHITAMELTDVGTIEDDSVCSRLFDVLVSNASYQSSGSVKSKRSLIIELDNGLAVELAVKDDSFSCCGKWSCPEFFEEYGKAVGQ